MVPKVSVIVPNYNHARFLERRLESILTQTYQDFELIILDDCSTDNSKEIIEKYREHPKVSQIIYNDKNSGSPFKQWAKGFDLAQGEYIWIAESDDWAEIHFLKKTVHSMEGNAKLSFAFCDSFYSSSNGVQRRSLYKKDCSKKGVIFIKEKMLVGNSVYNASAVLFKKECLSEMKKDYQDFKGSGDYLFWVYLCERGDVMYFSEALNYFQQHESNTTKKSLSSGILFRENFKVFMYLHSKKYVSFFRKQFIILNYLNFIEREFKNDTIKIEVFNEMNQLWKKELVIENAAFVYLGKKVEVLCGLILRNPLLNLKGCIRLLRERRLWW